MNKQTIPPLPPGFVLEGRPDPNQNGLPPLPPGFVLEAPRADFSGVSQRVDSTAEMAPPDFSGVSARVNTTATNPSLFRMDSDFRERAGLSPGNMLVGAARDMFGSRAGAAKYLAEQAGGIVEQDERGEPVVVLPDGQRYRMNDAGIDTTDIANLSGNIAALATPASWLNRLAQAKNVGLGGRAVMQGAGMGAADAALQLGFDDGQIDPLRTGAATVGGAAGEVLGAGLSRASNAFGGWSRTASGQNTRAAADMMADAGMTPNPAAAQRLAPQMEQIRAGADPRTILGQNEFGFMYTQGQRMTDPVRKFQQLSQEEMLRQRPGVNTPFLNQAEHNAARLGEALETMGTQFGRQPGARPAEMVQGSIGRMSQQADGLGQRIDEAYNVAARGGRSAVSGDAIAALPDRMVAAVRGYAPDPTLHPATSRTLARIRESVAEVASNPNVKGVTLKALETQRRIINSNIEAAANPPDRAAMQALKREFDGWMDDAVEDALVSGDPAALKAIKEARGLRAEYARRFEGFGDTDRFIAGLLDGSRTPEELVNIALGAGRVSKSSAARYIDRLKAAVQDDPGVMQGLRAAHFDRLTVGPNGKPLDPGQIIRNIESTWYSNASIVKALYSPKEWNQVQRLAKSLEPLVLKGDFARSSGSVERALRSMFSMVSATGSGVPILGPMAQGIGAVRSANAASRAVNAPLRLSAQSVPLAPATVSGVWSDKAR